MFVWVSCTSNRNAIKSKAKDRVETIEYRNFKGELIEDYPGK